MSQDVPGNLLDEIRILRSPKGYLYAGLPKFRALFGRDSIISSIQLIDLFPDIAQNTVIYLKDLQGRKLDYSIGEYPGKILHEYYDDEKIFLDRKRSIPWLNSRINYFSVDSTPLFILLIKNLFLRNLIDIEQFKDSIMMAMQFLIAYSSSDGLITYDKALLGAGLMSQSWRDGVGDIMDRLKSPVATVGVQGYFYESADFVLNLFPDSLIEESLPDLKDFYSKMREILENKFWLEETGYYGLAVDGDGVIEQAATSDPGHLIGSGILTRSRERDVIDRLFESDLLTDYGIRTLSAKDPRFDPKAYQRGSIWPQDNWIIADGIKRRGYLKEYRELRERLIAAYEYYGRMPEYFGVDRYGKIMDLSKLRIKPCYPQAWSTGAIINFVTFK
ncbi:conserved hypothetical protein [Thermoplasma acidophilum]|uniref:Mannosylglycerate hydrolase MGH1-like glycoside hydrolase domain-containing protein n=1 Tax=Thermoplasma acidophilum (strain ATCC 25905 / DSM 1728 / JCM 9062 / NBRC 15155 / AMRC-C165) TaxID=273075 RepID=Q9HLS8_THEAC|nr:amylo-alpha-1,6-glucosidase [Thermoplasma acidophilum]CAC11294.1 conserved hypothetical protein [Thermoplasma acidophilum]